MKQQNGAKQQKGYFDFGISVAILALSGLFAYSVSPDKDTSVAEQESPIEVAVNLETGNGATARHH